ncbi:T9SS type A sorting domain-containing protein [Aurantibacillus circumpalustris]|uniref:T9SS type A sorting domain-containing protein n=1 Tax=Aurantibacillus circumpalustris TaxID=3036359 RepID=UPI00295AB9E1|nr:T9SS type A sorting domain-containing protein [Aurantibacillus circumpalustris]
MNKNYLLFALNVCATAIIAQTPITLGNSNMPGSGDTLRYTNFQINTAGNYTQTGVNFTWNFSQVNSTTEGVRSFKNGLQTPYSILFGLNAYGEKIADTIGAGPLTMTNYYNFYKKQTSPAAFIADGVGMTFSSVPVPSYYSDKDELYNFPMTYPKYDSTTFKFTTSTGGIIPISYSKVGYRVTVVDGWGTITTPYGTENCLRLITTQYAVDSIKNTIIPIPLGFPNYQRSYQWMTLIGKIPYLEITGSLLGTNFTPTQARYRGYEKTQINVGISENSDINDARVYPNPVKDILYFQKNVKRDSNYEIYSLDGTKVLDLKTDLFETENQLNVSELEAGIYLIKATVDGQESYLKFIKQ